MVVVHLDLAGLLRFEGFSSILHAVGEDVGHGHQSHTGIDAHGVDRGPGTSAAASDDSDSQNVASCGVGAAGK